MKDIPTRRRALQGAVAALLGPAWLTQARAAIYPTRPITVVLPFGAGGSGDKIVRVMSPNLEKALGQPLLIESHAGASTNIGTDYVARARPDGYTLLLTGVPLAVNPSLFKKLSWSMDDLIPISLLSTSPYLLLANNELPVRSMRELLAYARQNPGKLSFSTSGSGSGAHMSGALIEQMAGVQLNHVPYKSSQQSLTDVIGGTVNITFSPLVTSVPLVKAGRIRALAVTSLKRSASVPDIPTIAESGLPGYEMISWYGVLAPRGTPNEVVQMLNKAFVGAMKDPAVARALALDGVELTPGSPQDFSAFLKRTAATAAEVVKFSGATVD